MEINSWSSGIYGYFPDIPEVAGDPKGLQEQL